MGAGRWASESGRPRGGTAVRSSAQRLSAGEEWRLMEAGPEELP